MTTDILTYGVPSYCAEIIIDGKRYINYLKGDNLKELETEAKDMCRKTRGAYYILYDACRASDSTISLYHLSTAEAEIELGFDSLGVTGW